MLEVSYWKLLEVILFISPNTFWRVGKLHDFGYKFLGTLGMLLFPYHFRSPLVFTGGCSRYKCCLYMYWIQIHHLDLKLFSIHACMDP
jgi:hypothetical protein